MRSLSSRIALTIISVVALTVIAAGIAAVQLVRSASQDEARSGIRAQAELISALPAGLSDSSIQRRLAGSLNDSTLSFVDASGTVTGAASGLRGIDRIVSAVLEGRSISTVTGEDGGTAVLVEARPSDGGGVIVSTPRDLGSASARQLVQRLLIALGIALVVAVTAAILLSRALDRPLRRLVVIAERMAGGERGIAPAATSIREIAAVGSALRSLDASLAGSELRQREFLQSVSHELRTPLTAIRGYGEALTDGAIGPGELPRVGRTLVDATDRAEAFVRDLLELSRLEADDFSVERVAVSLRSLLTELGDTWIVVGRSSGVALSVRSPELPLVSTDPRRLRQILDGLVGNALRLTPSGGVVVVEAVADGDSIRLEVRDSGPGLTQDDRVVAFQPGVLSERYRGSRPIGTGLGLAIAHRLAGRLGGELSVGSAPEGGAAFTLRLPR